MSWYSRGRNPGWGNVDPNNLPNMLVATYADLEFMHPELRAHFTLTVNLNNNSIQAGGANTDAERIVQTVGTSALIDGAETSAQNDIETEVISPEAERLNAERSKLQILAAQREKEAAETQKQMSAAKEKIKEDKKEHGARCKEEMMRKKAQKEEMAVQKAKQEIFERVERAEQARKTKKARKAAAERRRNFGAV